MKVRYITAGRITRCNVKSSVETARQSRGRKYNNEVLIQDDGLYMGTRRMTPRLRAYCEQKLQCINTMIYLSSQRDDVQLAALS